MIFIIKGFDNKPRSTKEIYRIKNLKNFVVDVSVKEVSPITIYPVKKMVGRWEVLIESIKNEGIKRPLLIVDVNEEGNRRSKLLAEKHGLDWLKHENHLIRQTLKLNQDGKNYKYLVIHGSHRSASAIKLGWKTVPAIKLEFAKIGAT